MTRSNRFVGQALFWTVAVAAVVAGFDGHFLATLLLAALAWCIALAVDS